MKSYSEDLNKNFTQEELDQIRSTLGDNFGVSEDPTIFEVESIIDKMWQDGVELFRVRWKNYASDEDTWEPRDNLDCPEILSKFENSDRAKAIDLQHEEYLRAQYTKKSKPKTPRKKKAESKVKKIEQSPPKMTLKDFTITSFPDEHQSATQQNSIPLMSTPNTQINQDSLFDLPSPPPAIKETKSNSTSNNIESKTSESQPKNKIRKKSKDSEEKTKEKSTEKIKSKSKEPKMSLKEKAMMMEENTKKEKKKPPRTKIQIKPDEKVVKPAKKIKPATNSSDFDLNLSDSGSDTPDLKKTEIIDQPPPSPPKRLVQSESDSSDHIPNDSRFVFQHGNQNYSNYPPKTTNFHDFYDVEASTRLPSELDGRIIFHFSNLKFTGRNATIDAHLDDGTCFNTTVDVAKQLYLQGLITYLIDENSNIDDVDSPEH